MGSPANSSEYSITPDAVAHQLLLNGKPDTKLRIPKPKIPDSNTLKFIMMN